MKNIFLKKQAWYAIPYLLLFGTVLVSGTNTNCSASWTVEGVVKKGTDFEKCSAKPSDFTDSTNIVYVNSDAGDDAYSGLAYGLAVATMDKGLEIMKDLRASAPAAKIVMFIENGTYDEITLDSDTDYSNTLFLGCSRDTIIAVTSSSYTELQRPLTINGLSDVTVSNMTLQGIGGLYTSTANPLSATAQIDNSTGIELSDITLDNNFFQAVYVAGSSTSTNSITLSNLLLTDPDDAATTTSTTDTSTGIAVASGATVTISDSTFSYGFTYGVVNDSATVTLQDLDFKSPTAGTGVGLHVTGSGSTTWGDSLTFDGFKYPVFSENADNLVLGNIEIKDTNTNGLIACENGSSSPALYHTVDNSILAKDTQAGEISLSGSGNTLDGTKPIVTNADAGASLAGDFSPPSSTVTFTCEM